MMTTIPEKFMAKVMGPKKTSAKIEIRMKNQNLFLRIPDKILGYS